MVDDDASTTRFLPSNTRLLEFGKGETATFTDLGLVTDSLCTDGCVGTLERADTKCSSHGLVGLTATKFAARLVEPGADTGPSFLVAVSGVEDVAVLATHTLCA